MHLPRPAGSQARRSCEVFCSLIWFDGLLRLFWRKTAENGDLGPGLLLDVGTLKRAVYAVLPATATDRSDEYAPAGMRRRHLVAAATGGEATARVDDNTENDETHVFEINVPAHACPARSFAPNMRAPTRICPFSARFFTAFLLLLTPPNQRSKPPLPRNAESRPPGGGPRDHK